MEVRGSGSLPSVVLSSTGRRGAAAKRYLSSAKRAARALGCSYKAFEVFAYSSSALTSSTMFEMAPISALRAAVAPASVGAT